MASRNDPHLQHQPMPGNHSKAEAYAAALRGACVLSRGWSHRWASAQFLIMGGSDDSGNGLAYSQRLSGVAPGKTPAWTVENMAGYRRFEGCAVLLPDGTVFLTSGAQHGAAQSLRQLPCMHCAKRCSRRAARLAAPRGPCSSDLCKCFPSVHLRGCLLREPALH